jgi:hypothetical protein
MSYFIDNKIAFWGGILAFLGSMLISLDRFNYFHEIFSNVGQWKQLTIALGKLDNMKAQSADRSPLGLIKKQDEGFLELAKIISLNRQDLSNKKIIAIAKNKPANLAGLDIAAIHVVTDDSPGKATPVCFEFGLMQWISSYRTEWFLYRGFILVTIGFLLNVISRIKRKKIVETSNLEPETPPPQ